MSRTCAFSLNKTVHNWLRVCYINAILEKLEIYHFADKMREYIRQLNFLIDTSDEKSDNVKCLKCLIPPLLHYLERSVR